MEKETNDFLDLNDSYDIRNFLRYEDLSIDSLYNKTLEILDRKNIKINEKNLLNSVEDFLNQRESTNLLEICNFISGLKKHFS